MIFGSHLNTCKTLHKQPFKFLQGYNMKVKLYIQASKWTAFGDGEEFKITASTFKSKSDASEVVIDIDEIEIDIDVPELNQQELNLAHADQLRGVKTKLKADTEVKLQSLDEQIESLLALENMS